MFRMESDSPPSDDGELIPPQDSIIQRLEAQGVPIEYLEELQPGLIEYYKANRSQLPGLISAILPTDDTDYVEDIHFQESINWLKWIMFKTDPDPILKNLAASSVGQHGVCGSVWGNNDIAYRCRTCEHDPTCAICVPCFQNGNHKYHDYSIIYTGGGCCDCGDVTAWKREGFCSKHKGAEQIQPLEKELANSIGPVLDLLFSRWKCSLNVAENVYSGSPRKYDHADEIKIADGLANAVVQMLLDFCNCSESLLSFISARVLASVGLLDILVRAERFSSDEDVKNLQGLLLKMLSEPLFKYEFAKVFLDYYPSVVDEAIKESNDSVFKKYPLLSTFSVQILTVPTLTPRLVKEKNLLVMLLECLGNIFASCAGEDGRVEVSKWINLYETTLRVVEDVRFVMSHAIVPKYITRERGDIAKMWMKLLTFMQGMDPQKRETGIHIEEENENMHLPFVLGHSIANIHSLLVAGAFSENSEKENDDEYLFNFYRNYYDDRDSSRHAKVGRHSAESSVSSAAGRKDIIKSDILLCQPAVSCLTNECLKAIESWIRTSNTSGILPRTAIMLANNKFAFKKTMETDYATEIEAFSVLSLSDWPEISYDVSSQPISVHIPLHRLLSMILQRAAKKCYGDLSSSNNVSIGSFEPSSNFFGNILNGCHPHGFSSFLMEHSLRIRVFCAQVHAGMWRKNGEAASLSWNWYRSVRWSEQGLELDLFLLQCCAALAPADLYVSRLLDRFGLSNYLDLNIERPSEYEPVLMQEMLLLIIQIVKERRFCGLSAAACLERELIYKLAIGNSTRSQLIKSLPRDLSKINCVQEILDKVAIYSNPTGMNQGMYKMRVEFWKQLDLYHPRWEARDLQRAEERYLRYCQASALATQLPKWTNIYLPFNGIAKIATCKPALQIIRSVLFYAVYTNNPSPSRAPDSVLLTALHLFSLSLDICFQHRESGNLLSGSAGNSSPILEFSGHIQEQYVTHANGSGEESLLSLFVAAMRKYRKQRSLNFSEAGSFNISSLIEDLLKKIAELDSGCMAKLREFAPEVVSYLSKSSIDGETNQGGLVSEADICKAKARERQAAIMEKMRSQQSKFMESQKSTARGEASRSEVEIEAEESMEDVCSLCHDTNSKNPLCFLILLQKSKLQSLVDKGPPSWKDSCCPRKEQFPEIIPPPDSNISINNSGQVSTPQFNQLIQSAIYEFASDGHPREVNAFVEFIKARFPSVRNIQLPSTSNKSGEKSSTSSLETLEEQIYFTVCEKMHDSMSLSDILEHNNYESKKSGVAESLLLGKYIATLSSGTHEKTLASKNALSRSPRRSESSKPILEYDDFGPVDCDGIHVSSCGHVVHHACLDRYLSSMKERYRTRGIVEGAHIVDPDQGEFLCPACRGLANSVLPALPSDSQKLFKQPRDSTMGEMDSTSCSTSGNKEIENLFLREALSLLHNAADIVGSNEILKSFPTDQIGRINPNLESVFRVLTGMYFSRKEGKILGSERVSHSMIMWDTLKYSIISTEIASRCKKSSLAPNFTIDALFKELKSSKGFILSLLLRIVQGTRTKNSLTVLLRLRSLQLFAESVCSGASVDDFASQSLNQGGNMPSILKKLGHEVPYPDIEFWRRVSDPIISSDAFSSLMWILFCLPSQFLSSEDSFVSFVHLFYGVSFVQAIISYFGNFRGDTTELGCDGPLVTEIFNIMQECGFARQYFVCNLLDPSFNIKTIIHGLTFPYLRKCGLLWKIINSSTSAPFNDGARLSNFSSHASDDTMEDVNSIIVEPSECEALEKMFKIPPLDVVLNNELLCSLVSRWLRHFNKEFKVRYAQTHLPMTPAVPFKLMHLPNVYQDLIQRYIKQHCPDCNSPLDEPALCLLCGKLCSPNWKTCCRDSGCQTHATACGAGIGVFLMVRKTTILLQRAARQSPWPSPYLDAFGEEDYEMQRGKPLYLNEERYAALTYMVASHGLDRSSHVLRQTNIGVFIMH